MKALIFDVDGTLAETEELHRQAFNRTFADAGLDWHWSKTVYGALLKTTGGKERMKVWRDRTGAALSDDRIARLHLAKTGHCGALLCETTVSLRPGIAELIAQAQAGGLRLAIATTTSGPNVEALCRSCFGVPADEIFEVIAAGDEVSAKKPAPDVYLLALERLKLDPAEAVALEDSRNGVLAAQAAGLKVVAAPSLYTSGDRFDEADSVVDMFTLDALEAIQFTASEATASQATASQATASQTAGSQAHRDCGSRVLSTISNQSATRRSSSRSALHRHSRGARSQGHV